MLNLNESFAGLRILSLVSKQNFHREVYEAQTPKGKKVYLIVYDNHNSRMLMEKGKMREFAMLKNLSNAAFPELISIGSSSYHGRAMSYMTAKHFEGMTLRTMVGGKPLSVGIAVNIALQVMTAVKDLIVYTSGGGHYNLNPDTVIVSRTEGGIMVHLGGLDHVAGPCSGNPLFITADLNPCCRAPETYQGRYSSASDVFSMGMLLGYMLMGYYPYNIDESTTECRIRSVTNSGILPDLDELPDGLKDIVSKAVSKKKRERYTDLYDMFSALGKYANENNIDSKAPIISETQEPRVSDADKDGKTEEEHKKDEQEQSDSKTPRLKIEAKVKKGEGLKAVAGMEELKIALRRDFVDIMNNRELAERFGIKPNNIILYGPQGCGKTYISNRLAEEIGMATFSVNPSDLGSIYLHGTQGLIRQLFQKAEEKAKQNSRGCLLLVDEIDAHLAKRDMSGSEYLADEVSEWLVQLNDCIQKNVFVIGMTNRLDRLDRAAIRHGRFDKVFYVDLPDATGREELLKMEVGKVPHEPRIDYKSLAMMCDGFTASDLSYVVKEAAGLTFSTCLSSHNDKLVVKETLLKEVASATRPSVTTEELRKYRSIWDEFMNKNTTQRQAIGYRVYN